MFGAQIPSRCALPQRATTAAAPAPARAPSRSRAPNAAARPGPPGAPERCSARWSPPARARAAAVLGEVIATPCPTCRGEGRSPSSRPTRSTFRPASTTARRCGSRGRGAAGPRGGPAGDLYVHLRVAPHDRYRARRRRPRHRGPDLDRPGRARHHAHAARRSTATRSSIVPAGTQPGREFVLRGRGVPATAGPGPRRPAARSRGRGADQAQRRPRTSCCASFAEERRRGRRRRRARPVLEDQVGVLVIEAAATGAPRQLPPTSFVDDVDDPVLDDDDRASPLPRAPRADGDAVTVTDGRRRWRPCRVVRAATSSRRRDRRRAAPIRAADHGRLRARPRATGRSGSCRS